MFNKVICLGLAFLCTSVSAVGAELDQKAVAMFIDDLVKSDGFERTELTRVFSKATRSERILKAMSRPAEKTKPWFEYKKHFITDA